MPLFGTDGRRFADGVFKIGREHGFLPEVDPATRVPSPAFDSLQDILDRMPVHVDGSSENLGLLGKSGAIVVAVKSLPNLVSLVDALDAANVQDARDLQVLFRGYAFLTSAYLLESAYHDQTHGRGRYGKARTLLPRQLAMPFASAAAKLGQRPWLEYHYAYSLGNYVRKDPNKGFHWSNLGMAVSFSGLTDETGFIMLHVHINSKTPALLGAMEDALEGARRGDDAAMCRGIAEAAASMKAINQVRRQMWQASRPDHYNDFRAFIMGVQGNEAIFGRNGVVFEGVEALQGQPQKPRGQTGAQDDVVPSADIFSGLTKYYPRNRLTEYLLDLRQYRPLVVQKFFQALAEEVENVSFHQGVRRSVLATSHMIELVEQLYLFRNGHWQFVQRYIMAQTQHEVATGGTPITTWLPNQLEAALAFMQEMMEHLQPHLDALDEDRRRRMKEVAAAQGPRVQVLQKQMEVLGRETHYDAKLIYEFNALSGFDDSSKPALELSYEPALSDVVGAV